MAFNLKKRSYFNPKLWSKKYRQSFSQLWALPKDWFEPPNKARGGWSGVSRAYIETREGKTAVFVKRQEQYVSRTWLHPIRGIPTFQKELQNIQRLKKLKIPTLRLVYFGKENDRALLITKALDKYVSLDKLDPTSLTQAERRKLIRKLAKLTRKLHRSHYVHNCFYPKHVFVRLSKQGKWKIRFIDLEKLRWRFSSKLAMKRDLASFNRHADLKWSAKDRVYFYKNYMKLTSLNKKNKKILRSMMSNNK
ncbi:lipopolysaccharide kinase InaA family protein [Methylophaga sp. OBS3]|uniref:lipopolysaccharide kinase InaA family protein n=1 Tax=Methylophaga sp. OBS3 TaxID=2991934 RepID=UPI00224F99FF|nr:lipopolysaccharide kinase InaA family protein [Methylophaga sp. OBS3]MCX4190743.1 lipopolysaccharide kinase InaA family protein [Methylophaga sp. OBS3]